MSPDGLDDPFVDLLDATTAEAAPIAASLLAILEERGWSGWTRIERTPADRPDSGPSSARAPSGC